MLLKLAVELTNMQESDLPEVVAIESDSFPCPWSSNIFERELISPLSICRVARVLEAEMPFLAGYLVCWIYAGEAHIHNIAVKKEYRRIRVAGRLIEDAIRLARQRAAGWLFLEVRTSNDAAIALYEKYGFRRLGMRKCYYLETGEDALVLGREI